MHRMLRDGQTVRVQLKLGAKLLGEVESANVVGELRGTDRAAEVVLLGAHLDSWDLGSGAIDDGAGCALVLEAARLIAAVTAKPQRTVRVVLFMNEENGLSGARAYARAHEAELSKHIAAMELDAGAGRPVGFEVAGGTQSVEILKKLTAHVDALHLEEVKGVGGAGADLTPLQSKGVPVVGVRQEGSTYFHWHHTAADTLDKIDPTELSWTAAMVAVLAHSLANSDVMLPPSPPPARGPQPEEQPQSQTHQ